VEALSSAFNWVASSCPLAGVYGWLTLCRALAIRCSAMEGWARMDCFVASACLAVVARVCTFYIGACSMPHAGASSLSEVVAHFCMSWVISSVCCGVGVWSGEVLRSRSCLCSNSLIWVVIGSHISLKLSAGHWGPMTRVGEDLGCSCTTCTGVSISACLKWSCTGVCVCLS
jgi:putative Mn2+ efflux pump MntP